MKKVKVIVKRKTHSNYSVLKNVKKGMIKLGINSIGKVVSSFNKAYYEAKSKVEAKKAKAAAAKEYQEQKILESLILQEKADKQSKEITTYCTENNCSRKVARKKLSQKEDQKKG